MPPTRLRKHTYIQAIDPQARGDLVDHLPLFVGMQCIVTVNVNTQWSIANGSRGTIYAIGLDPREIVSSNNEVCQLQLPSIQPVFIADLMFCRKLCIFFTNRCTFS